jgi:hypothetical protein
MDCPASEQGDLIRLWTWNPGQGASSRLVYRDQLDLERQELRALGFITWTTGAVPMLIG